MLIPLKKYINNWLNTYTVKDIFTGKYQLAREIFDWDKSYFLKLLIKDKYYIDTDIDFVTKNLNYVKVEKTPLSQITPKKVKKFREITKIVPEEIIEEVIDYIPVEVKKYRLIDAEPIYKTVIRRRKIGRKYFLTTQYIPTGKFKKQRQYYTDIEYIEKIRSKKRTIYRKRKILEPYYEQVRERTEEDIATKITEHRFYEPFFVFDFYKKVSEDEYIHYLYIAPFFDGYGSSVKIGSDDDEIIGHRRLPRFITPKELTQTNMYKSAYKQCRYMIMNGKEKLMKKNFKEINDRIDNNEELHTINMSDSNLYSLDILNTGKDGIFFFKASDIPGNEKYRII